jgi:hypothetical protein
VDTAIVAEIGMTDDWSYDYSETRHAVSRNHDRQVDVTIRGRHPCANFNRTR